MNLSKEATASVTVNRTPLVSVIVPNYRHEKYLGKRLSTITAQTHSNIEIILLDDKSPDNSASVLTEFASVCEKVVALHVNESNSGQPVKQWIKGVSLAKGEFVWIAESDDEAEPELITTLLSLLEGHPSAGIAYCNSKIIDENSRMIASYDYSSSLYCDHGLWEQDFHMKGKDFVADYMAFRNVIPNVSAVLFNSSVLKKHLHDCNFKYCADWELYNRILLSHDIVFTNKLLNKFRRHVQTTRWHNHKSYAIELKEKIALLKSLKNAMAPDENAKSNINSSLRFIFANRHKYKRVECLCSKIAELRNIYIKQLYIFGANDIAERAVEVSLALNITPIVIDTFKAGKICKGIKIVSLNVDSFDASDVIVICSLGHQETMQRILEERGFEGRLLRI